jgi:hypothetical protein
MAVREIVARVDSLHATAAGARAGERLAIGCQMPGADERIEDLFAPVRLDAEQPRRLRDRQPEAGHLAELRLDPSAEIVFAAVHRQRGGTRAPMGR